MKKRVVFIFLALFFVLPFNIYAMDELEKAYKEQMEAYNSEISIKQATLKIEQDASNRYLKLGHDALPYGSTRMANSALVQYFESVKKRDGLQNEINDLKNKRRELKIKVLEKYQTLPEWWVEPDAAK